MKLKIISSKDLQSYTNHPDSLLIDLREKDDYDSGHIPGAVWADWETLDQNIEQILERQHSTIHQIILYCDRGNISLLVSRDLARLGFTTISLNGGYKHWKEINKQL